MDTHSLYENPLITRYSSRPMAELWSARRKFATWRRLWVALAEAQRELGLKITEEQIDQLREKVEEIDLDDVERRIAGLKFLGVKGTTGTQASFLALFGGDHAKVEALDRRVAEAFGFAETYPVSGQTYSRKVDSQVIGALAGVAESAHRFGTDLRLLAHERELEEPFEAEQVGSSAMAYRRNRMGAE